jgi:hypothetical protein
MPTMWLLALAQAASRIRWPCRAGGRRSSHAHHKGEGAIITATAGTIPCATISPWGCADPTCTPAERSVPSPARHQKIDQLNQ